MENNSILHILNGDSTLAQYEKCSVEGPTMVWREALAQGPLFYDMDTKLFWDMRSQFMVKAYNAKLPEYKKEVVNEFKKLRNFKGEKLVLWFEYDLFCQVNMVAILSYILKHHWPCKVNLVCIGRYPGMDSLVGLGEVPYTHYAYLYRTSKSLRKEDLVFADKVWMAWCGMERNKLMRCESNVYEYLGTAMRNGLRLLPEKHGLSPYDFEILNKLKEKRYHLNELVKELMEQDNILGFGDLQFEYMIRNLKKYIDYMDHRLMLNRLGKQVLNPLLND